MEDKENKRIPPQSIDAEKAVLGCMLINNEAVSVSMQYLTSDSFYDKSNSLIFKTMCTLYNNSKPIDSLSLIDELKKNKIIDSIGGPYYVTGLSQEAPTASNVEYYAKIVREKQILREIINTSVKMSSLAYEGHENASVVLDQAEQFLFALSEKASDKKFEEIQPMIHKVLDIWGKRKKGDITGVSSGFRDLDNQISGFQDSDFIVLAARPSMGKTALALNISRNIAVNSNKRVGFFSLEMSSQQLIERMLSSEAQISSHLVRTGKLPTSDWRKLSNAAGSLSEADMFIDDSGSLNIMELRAKARQMKSEKNIDIIIIDYLQLLHKGGRVESRQQEISYISRSLKSLAKELNIPIIALSQLSRAVESRSDHRPLMSDLRESGAIEQDADIVLFIFRKYLYSKQEEDKGLSELIVAKHRNGPTGTVKLTFFDEFAKFQDYEFVHDEFIDDLDINDAVFES
ncbi:MAG: replicative DNA helicase [Candidatus Marinimicrobia bacterium]|nr:replicative DNA helicase [Candidatus Neomarinimicrobiota bacterium]